MLIFLSSPVRQVILHLPIPCLLPYFDLGHHQYLLLVFLMLYVWRWWHLRVRWKPKVKQFHLLNTKFSYRQTYRIGTRTYNVAQYFCWPGRPKCKQQARKFVTKHTHCQLVVVPNKNKLNTRRIRVQCSEIHRIGARAT